MALNETLYLLSMSLQIGGTFLLTYMSFVKTPKQIVAEIVPVIPTATKVEEISFPQIQGKLLEIYLSRAGFGLVLLGYSLSIFGDVATGNKIEWMFGIATVSTVISGLTLLGLRSLVKKRTVIVEKQCITEFPEGGTFYKEMEEQDQ